MWSTGLFSEIQNLRRLNRNELQLSCLLGLGRISGSSNIRSALYECQISNTNFYLWIFGTFPNSMSDIMIYGQSDILSKYTDSFSLNSLNSTSMEGKILVKNPHGSSKVWKHFGFYKACNKVLEDFAVCFVCKQECKYSGGTTNLNQHIEKHHSELCQYCVSLGHLYQVREYLANLVNFSIKREPLLKVKM